MQTFCTIITPDYFPLARVLLASLKKYDPGCTLHVLSIDNISTPPTEGIKILTTSALLNADFFSGIEKKYASGNKDIFRWALKPVFLGHLLQSGFSKVIFLDPDIYFTNAPGFIFELLDKYDILLTPHWPDPDIVNNPDSVLTVMKSGLYNAGFVAANINGLPALSWWSGMCQYLMGFNADLGVYDDQKYLDLLPVQFDNVHIVRHQGCNLAAWNIKFCKRELVEGQLRINGKFVPVFIHFAKDTIINILNRNDVLLKPYLDEYMKLLAEYGFDLLKNIDQPDPGRFDSGLYRVKHKIRLRTRVKRFLFKLAEKL